ncbi:MAG: hypothetical protein WD070_08545 [Pirellulaceae bacterium]
MLTSFALLAALTIGADGEPSTNIAPQTHKERQAEVFYGESSRRTAEVVVRPISEHGHSVRAAVDLASNITNGEPEQDSTPNFEVEGGIGFDDCGCCYGSNPHGNLGFHHRFYPSAYRSPGNMPQHFPYVAEPKNYYYFRPYNWFHIADQQREVTSYGGDTRHPYANDLFQEVYEAIEAESGSPAVGN